MRTRDASTREDTTGGRAAPGPCPCARSGPAAGGRAPVAGPAGTSARVATLLDSRPRRTRPGGPAIDTPTIVALVALALAAVAAAACGWLYARLRHTERTLESLTRGVDGKSLTGVIETHLDKVYAVARETDGLQRRTATLEADGRKAFQRFGLVRYNPFEDTGGNQSFALALLDADGDGAILTSLHTRQATRMYAKPVRGGRSDAALSAEETEALRIALGG